MTATLAPPPPVGADHPPAPPADRGRLARVVRGRTDDPAWARPALLTLLALTGALYLWDLAASGYANSFYAAAVQAGSQSWKAWFFGSLDSGNAITVDKPPAALWVDGLSARIFGFGSWSLLVPQALEGVAAVGLLYGAVRRVSGHAAGLVAGALLALTPAAVLMFRFDNPDALLVLLMTAGAYAIVRALEAGSARWVVLAGTAIGFAFLTKMLQGLLVLPAFALVYLIAAPTSLRRRVGHVLLGGLAVVVSAGWWVTIVELWPASSRPYIGGSTDNSVLDLVFGYNGFGRLFGGDGNGGGGMSGGTSGSSFGGATGLTRLFGSEMGNEISWLLPAALVALVAGLLLRRRAPRTDGVRASLVLWGGWLVVTGLVFDYMQGTVHPYYTVALAPAIAAVVAIGGAALWRARGNVAARVGLGLTVVAAGWWSIVLLGRTSSWHPELRWIVLVAMLVALAGVLTPSGVPGRAAKVGLVAAVATGVLGLGSFGLATAAQPHTGSIPSVGPAAAQTGGMGGGSGGRSGGLGGSSTSGGFGGSAPTGGVPGGSSASAGPGGSAPTGGAPGSSSGSSSASTGTRPSGSTSGGSAPTGGGGSSTSAALVRALRATTGTWAAAVSGSQSAASLQLASGKAVIAIGGFSGTDDAPSLVQFEQWVKDGRIGYYIASGSGGGGMGGSSSSAASQIAAWVKAHFTATTIGGTTVYKLTS